jgi:hypothetical protein
MDIVQNCDSYKTEFDFRAYLEPIRKQELKTVLVEKNDSARNLEFMI